MRIVDVENRGGEVGSPQDRSQKCKQEPHGGSVTRQCDSSKTVPGTPVPGVCESHARSMMKQTSLLFLGLMAASSAYAQSEEVRWDKLCLVASNHEIIVKTQSGETVAGFCSASSRR